MKKKRTFNKFKRRLVNIRRYALATLPRSAKRHTAFKRRLLRKRLKLSLVFNRFPRTGRRRVFSNSPRPYLFLNVRRNRLSRTYSYKYKLVYTVYRFYKRRLFRFRVPDMNSRSPYARSFNRLGRGVSRSFRRVAKAYARIKDGAAGSALALKVSSRTRYYSPKLTTPTPLTVGLASPISMRKAASSTHYRTYRQLLLRTLIRGTQFRVWSPFRRGSFVPHMRAGAAKLFRLRRKATRVVFRNRRRRRRSLVYSTHTLKGDLTPRGVVGLATARLLGVAAARDKQYLVKPTKARRLGGKALRKFIKKCRRYARRTYRKVTFRRRRFAYQTLGRWPQTHHRVLGLVTSSIK